MVREFLASGALIEALPQLRGVYSDGEPLAFWLLYAQHRPSTRVKIFADYLIARLPRVANKGGSLARLTTIDAATNKSKT
jgi:hypothetical protein